MSDDERAIRELDREVDAGEPGRRYRTVLGLMTEDVVFMVPGREPFGKDAFAASRRHAGRGSRARATSAS